MSYAYEAFFPFSVMRSEQKDAIEFALDAFLAQGKRFVILELGTGTGKSAVGITVSRYLQHLYETGDGRNTRGGSYFLTTQKVLQEQYVKDFGNNTMGKLKLIKSASGYCCQFFDKSSERASCAEVRRLLKTNAPAAFVYKLCEESCRFTKAKQDFFESPEGITNYAYFLTSALYTRDIEKRGLLVLDEAHNIDSAVGNFVKIGFSNHFYRSILGVKTPPVNSGQKVVYDWLVNTCRPKLRDVIRREAREVNGFSQKDSKEAIEKAKRVEALKRNFSKIEHFVESYDPNTWVLDVSKTDARGERIYEFKPIDVSVYCEETLFSNADKVLALSATILDKDVYCDSIGIPKDNVAYMRIPSPFPAENRPVYSFPVGSMSRQNIESTLPALAAVIKTILDQHPDEKGIVHCTTYKIAEYLNQHVDTDRFLTHTADYRDEVIKYHVSNERPTVLLSPSMTEGVDLADDASRFQIICKMPFPYLGDAVVQRRMKRNPAWYRYETVKTIVQSLGRSIRNENDRATSYILDADWERFYSSSKDMFPVGFSELLKKM